MTNPVKKHHAKWYAKRTRERTKLLCALWPTPLPTRDLLGRLNALPGLRIHRADLSSWAHYYGVKRHADVAPWLRAAHQARAMQFAVSVGTSA